MKNLDFSNPDNIRKFQKVFNETVEKKIYESERKKLLGDLENRSINSLATIFESMSDKLFESEAGKSLIRKYVKAINENADLKKAYQFRNAVIDPHTNNPESYLNEAISMASIEKNNYEKGKKNLSRILREMVELTGVGNKDIVLMLNENEHVSDSLEYLLSNKKYFKNLHEYVSNKEVVRDYINENKKPLITEESEESKTTTELIGELNGVLKSLDEWQRNAMVKIAENRLSRLGDDKLFEEFKNDCLSVMKEKIEESDDAGEVSKLKLMETQLSEKTYDEKEFINDIMNLAELKKTLSE